MEFNEIIGNNNVKQILNKAIEENHISHSYLLIGKQGIGKTLIAKAFAKKILCLNLEKKCNCESCIKWENNNHPDFKEIESENGSIKIEQIRKLQEEIVQKPIISKKKVYIIKDCDLMTKEAQNCLLKTLEEPPMYSTIILTTANETKILTTVKSRCLKIPMKEMTEEEIKEYFKKLNLQIIDETLINMSEGSIEKAIKLQEDKQMYQNIAKLLENINEKSISEIFKESQILYKQKEKITDILDYINVYLYNLKKINCIKYVEETKKRLNSNSNYDMCIDYLLLKIKETM